ncbi:MAG: dihydropteroate synthase [Lentisphaeria bacterium]|nr:dihydropteroate synthase [Lentisphaeria bacterium]
MSKIPLIMGIVNATGNSFSEGASSDPASALDRALKLIDAGADIIDVGAESTRPGAEDVPEAEERERIGKLVKSLNQLRPSTPVSVDTRRSSTARAALDCGAKYINDVSMLRFDCEMANITAEYGAALILCHSRGTPQNMRNKEFCSYNDVVEEVVQELAAAAEYAKHCGVGELIFDPGFGFAKSVSQQMDMLRNANAFTRMGKTLAGVSRKSFLGAVTGEDDPAERQGSTLAAELHLAACGIDIIRTHNVKMLRDALTVKNMIDS